MFQMQLEREIYSLPHWDRNPKHDLSKRYLWEENDITATGMAEAVESDHMLLSFDMEKFRNCILQIQAADKKENVSSIYSPAFLVESAGKQLEMQGDDIPCYVCMGIEKVIDSGCCGLKPTISRVIMDRG